MYKHSFMDSFNFKTYGTKNSWLGLVLVIFVIIIIYLVLRSLYKLLFVLAPVFVILSLLLDYRVIVKFGIVIYELLRYKTLWGIIAVIFSIVGFPFLSAALFFNSFMNFRTKKRDKKTYTDYTYVEDTDDEVEVLDLNSKEKVKIDSYEDLFE